MSKEVIQINKKIYIHDSINNVIFFLTLLFILIYYLERSTIFLHISAIMGLVILLRFFIVKRHSIAISLTCGVIFGFVLIKFLFYGSMDFDLIVTIFYLVSQLGLAFFIIREDNNADKSLLILFYIAFIYLMFQWINNVNPNDVIFWSTNSVIFIVLSLSLSVYLSRFIRGKKVLLHPALMTLIVALWTNGRSGIIASLLLLLIIIIYKYGINKRNILVISSIFGFILLISNTITSSLKGVVLQIATRDGTREGILTDVRFEIWKDYFNKMNFKELFLGFNTNEYHSFYGFSNLHNSFLDGHYFLGLLMLIVYLLLIICIFKLIKIKEYFPLLLLIVFLLRGTTDSVIFTGRFDYIFISIILYSFNCFRAYKSSIKSTSYRLTLNNEKIKKKSRILSFR